MNFIKKLSGGSSGHSAGTKMTTKGLFLGAPEAEAETSQNARIKLIQVFEDYLGAMHQLGSEKFIVTGRKGCGKSAIAEYLQLSAAMQENVFVDFVKKADIDFEKLLQIASPLNAGLESKTILEWLILVRFCKQILRNESIAHSEGHKNLGKFFERNRGLVDLKDFELKSLVETKNGEIAVELFERAFRGILGRKTEFQKERAPFYRLIPYLKDVLIGLLSDPAMRSNEVEYCLIFDDLDIGLNSSDAVAMTHLGDLLRVCRDYNNVVFGATGLPAKIIVLLRDDIVAAVKSSGADLGKIIDSYEIRLSWYDHRAFDSDEEGTAIKRFINKRIDAALNKLNWNVEGDPWSVLIDIDQNWGYRSSFKYVLDHTLYRPRDLLLVFKDMDQMNLTLPLSRDEVDKYILPKHSLRMMGEWSNELLFALPKNAVDQLILTLPQLVERGLRFNLDAFRGFYGKRLGVDPELVLRVLFNYSIIGHIDDESRVFFKHREDPNRPLQCSIDKEFTFHRAILEYSNSRLSGN